MPDIHIRRDHQLGLSGARQLATQWVDQAQTRFDMRCTYEMGEAVDEVQFTRSGVNGTLTVSADHFELNAQLGFLLGAFKDRIEGEIAKNLDGLLAAKQPAVHSKSA